MKKPYIKKIYDISKFSVWLVDGNYIRANINEEFTNFGHHLRFSFIPKNEFWIDHERNPGEEEFYIDSMLITNRLMSEGVPHDIAVAKADKFEEQERRKRDFIKKRFDLRKKNEVISKVHKKLLNNYSKNRIKIWIVDGELVRDLFFIDFAEGGHDKVYNFIPKDEIWIDDDVYPTEVPFILLHEIHERNLMAKGWDYEKAHKDSSKIEYYCRHHPKKLKETLNKEIMANKLI